MPEIKFVGFLSWHEYGKRLGLSGEELAQFITAMSAFGEVQDVDAGTAR